MAKIINLLCLTICISTPHLLSSSVQNPPKMYFCTAADTRHYTLLKILIGSIHQTNFDNTQEIAVFDLGLSNEQINELMTMQKVAVYPLEIRHPDILQNFKVNKSGKIAKGWYAWKPVAIKQALDMYPYVLWLDASHVILKPLDNLFKHIIQNGYFLMGYVHKIKDFTPRTLAEKFNLNDPENQWILEMTQIEAGIQGIFKESFAYTDYLLPVYDLTTDLTNFSDDGTGPKGFGWSRHDQTLFSIFARLCKMEVLTTNHRPTKMFLSVDGKLIPFNADWEYKKPDTDIYYAAKGKVNCEKSIRYKAK